MAAVIDTSVWVDLFHPKTPPSVRELARLAVERDDAALCEPVRLEFLRGVPDAHYAAARRFLETVPLLATPPTLWTDALKLARESFRRGHPASGMDTLIAAVCAHHRAELVTFDRGFESLAGVAGFPLVLLTRNS
jgi:predicted nucleic acid-binding protein